jgi:PAS domain S-box-containing protein
MNGTATARGSRSAASTARYLGVGLLYILVFLFLTEYSALFAIAAGVMVWYAPAGLNFALLLIFGLHCAPFIVVAGLLGGLWVLAPDAPLASLLIVAFTTPAVEILAVIVIHRVIGRDWQGWALRDFILFVLIIFVTPILVAVLGISNYAAFDMIAWTDFLTVLLGWWIGDVIGILTVAPFILFVAYPLARGVARHGLRGLLNHPRVRRARANPVFKLTVAGQVISIPFVLWFAFLSPQSANADLFYFCFLPLIWIVFSHGLPGAVLGVGVINVGATLLVVLSNEIAAVTDLQFFLLMLTLTGLFSGKLFTERDEAVLSLHQSEARYRMLVEQAADGIFVADRHGRYVQVNRAGCAMLGYTREELLSLHMHDLVPEGDQEDNPLEFEALRAGEAVISERRLRRRDGSLLPVEISGIQLPNGDLQGIVRDITTRKRAEEKLRAALREKELLLRELYHRTKNNMQVIMTLLDFESDQVCDSHLTASFTETKNRIQSMALVHQLLYQSHDLSHINLRQYVMALTELLHRTYHVAPERVAVTYKLDDVFVMIDSAIPCGLILNEVISNALSHAFPGERTGEITITLRRTGDGAILLVVADDGLGVEEGFDFRRDGHLGLQTVFALGEQQLQGAVRFVAEDGVACHVRFRDDLYRPRV